MAEDRKITVKFKDNLFNVSLEGEKRYTGKRWSKDIHLFSLTYTEINDITNQFNNIIRRQTK